MLSNNKYKGCHNALSLIVSMACFGCIEAEASGIPFAGNRPQSFQFFSNFTEPYNSVAQYVQWNDDGRRFDEHGDKVSGSGTNTYVGQTSILQYFKVDGLPDNGFVVSATVPEVAIRGNGVRVSGFGDPLVGALAWYNPSPLRTIGAQAYVQIPVGSDAVSSGAISFWPSIFYDEWFGRWNIDILLGGIIRGEAEHDVEPGNTMHANIRLGYKIIDDEKYEMTPFLSYDRQKTWKSDDGHGNDLHLSDSRETALGAGVLFQLKPGIQSLYAQKMWDQVSIHYSAGVSGRNTTVTDGLFFQAWHYW